MPFTENQRVMIKPQTTDEANAGWEQPEGTVVAPGKFWNLVLLDLEFRSPTNPNGLVEIHTDMLEPIE